MVCFKIRVNGYPGIAWSAKHTLAFREVRVLTPLLLPISGEVQHLQGAVGSGDASSVQSAGKNHAGTYAEGHEYPGLGHGLWVVVFLRQSVRSCVYLQVLYTLDLRRVNPFSCL